MGWILEALFDWFLLGTADKAARKLPGWASFALLVLAIAILAAALWLLVG